MVKINWKPIGDFAKQACDIALYAAMLAISCKVGDYVIKGSDSTHASYGDAVGAITNSDMFSHDKSTAIAALKRDEFADYYRAVIHVAKDTDAFSHDKLNMIEFLSKD